MINNSNYFRMINILIASFFITSCASEPFKAPIVDADPIPTRKITSHVVAPGETLYSISLRYDVDYKKIASINNLSSNYKISTGQVLSLDTSRYMPPQTVKPVVKPRSTHNPVAAPKSPISVSVKPDSPSTKSQKNQTVQSAKTSPSLGPVGNIQWQWPVKGEVLEGFQGGDGLNKGIDIRGNLGEPVLAAANGEVVYSGTGLRGYGKLIIIKHNEQFLSAYAHNRVLLVAEGDKVKAGQKIAEVGFSGTNTAKLHFEIRLDGKPVDPLAYLPSLRK